MSGLKDFAQKLLPGKGVPEQPRPGGDEPSREENALTQTKLDVAGMTCGHCKAAVEEELGNLDGVEHSDADFESGAVEVRYDDTKVTTEDLNAAVEEAGYAVTS